MAKKIVKEVDKKYFVRRLNIIDGQIKGLVNMIESEREYEEVLIQLVAFTNSLRTLGTKILESYMQNNVDFKNPRELKEIMSLINKLL